MTDPDLSNRPGFTIEPGIRPAHRARAIQYFWAAFGQKLRVPLGPEQKAVRFLDGAVDPAHAISAVSDEGELLGVAGFKTEQGAFVGGGFSDLKAVYGTFGAIWRAVLLSLLERDKEPGELLMDGIFVGEAARGKGVGTALLDAIVAEAQGRGLPAVRLDVIDTNPRARALYERRGFEPVDEMQLGPLKSVFGFASATRMRLSVPGSPS
ncbi:GNAT family N-acetyltransferase [Cucumibacter marinus]|uniref:GNAT family N-acetyltransferase n=1 Tax=Cucumibacter marinus TaxID=1121252 RepID=UPI00041F7962|nr:GNAT family N-acetyltransferase [Cucumibacter marinus]